MLKHIFPIKLIRNIIYRSEKPMYLDIHNISKSFQRKDEQPLQALENINLEINKGEFVSLLWPSGCGKSTLLSIIAGLSKPSSGSRSEERRVGKEWRSRL